MAFTLEILTFTIILILYIGIEVQSFWGCRKHSFRGGVGGGQDKTNKKTPVNTQKDPQQHLLEKGYIALLGLPYSTSNQRWLDEPLLDVTLHCHKPRRSACRPFTDKSILESSCLLLEA